MVETDVEGIVLKQTKVGDTRKILTIFTEKYGKIQAGTTISERGRGKSALAIRPFTCGSYNLYRGRDSFNINSAEPVLCFYGLGDDVEKFTCGSYVLEFADRLLHEEEPFPELFRLLKEMLLILEERRMGYISLLVVFRWKVIQLCGMMPVLESCSCCGESEAGEKKEPGGISAGDDGGTNKIWFSVKQGGLICSKCRLNLKDESLLYAIDADIIGILKFIRDNPMASFRKLVIDEKYIPVMNEILRDYISFHMGIKRLKSENFLTQEAVLWKLH